MPVMQDSSGHFRYVSPSKQFYKERPEYFLGIGDEYEKRLRIARERVLEAVRFAAVPLTGKGTCHEVHGHATVDALADFVDSYDDRRARVVRKQNAAQKKSALYINHVPRMKSPQDVKRRRSALISGSEISPSFFRIEYGFDETARERERFVNLMRWWLIRTAIERMVAEHELVLVSAVWYVPVSVLDNHGPARKQRRRKSQKSSKRTKRDDRSFHGRPNRDRGKVAA